MELCPTRSSLPITRPILVVVIHMSEVNRELGWRIKNSMPVEVVEDDNGKPVEHCNLKEEVIQSYTLLALRGEKSRPYVSREHP
jgi:hypothetical protein